jgi:hypothetical protein
LHAAFKNTTKKGFFLKTKNKRLEKDTTGRGLLYTI